MTRRYVILGNGIAGQTCAEELRARDPDCSIVMIAAERHPLYNRVALPRFLRKAEKKLKRLHRRFSRTKKKSANRTKARQKLAKAYLKVQRQREDFARKTANTLVSSHDLIAYEDLKIANMLRNHTLAKSISDAAWGRFLQWVNYYGALHAIPVIAVPPQFTSQNCSGCGSVVRKSLSEPRE